MLKDVGASCVERQPTRRPYERPELERFGSFDDLTKASTGRRFFDANFEAGQPIPPTFGVDYRS